MKAVVITRYGDPEVLEYREVPDPSPGPNELLIRVRASALNRADLLQRRGLYPPPGPPPKFEIPGLEYAGQVEKVGSSVSEFRPGERVMGLCSFGGQAEKLVLPQAMAMRVPDNLDWHQAASLPEVFITAHDALVIQCGLHAGESVLVHAAGSGVGIAAIQIAKSIQAGPIIGTASSDEKLRRARQLGLDRGVNYRNEDFAGVVEKATGGRGVDVLLDVIGAEYWDRNIRALAPKGRMILVGFLGGTNVQANLASLLSKRLTVRGTSLRPRSLEEKIAATRAFEREILPRFVSRQITPVVDRIFPASEIQAAHRYMESNANFGKIVIDMS